MVVGFIERKNDFTSNTVRSFIVIEFVQNFYGCYRKVKLCMNFEFDNQILFRCYK